MSKYGIFLKNSQNTACQTTIWFHFICFLQSLKQKNAAVIAKTGSVTGFASTHVPLIVSTLSGCAVLSAGAGEVFLMSQTGLFPKGLK